MYVAGKKKKKKKTSNRPRFVARELITSITNQLSQYANSLVTGPTVTQNSTFSSLAVAITIASTHFAYSRRDDPG